MSIMPNDTSLPAEAFEGNVGPQAIYSYDTEKAVLGCMLVQPHDVMDEVIGLLTDADFFVPAHIEIFRALKDMWGNRVAIDIMVVHQFLSDRGMAEAVGSPGILGDLMVGFASHLNLGSYVKIVKDKSLLRHLMEACTTIAKDIASSPDNVADVLDRAETAIFHVTHSSLDVTEAEAMTMLADQAYERITSRRAVRGLVGLDTGFWKLNQLTAGWKPGEMIVLAARPGLGKTAMGMKFAMNCASGQWAMVEEGEEDRWIEPGRAVGVLSLEMTTEQLMDRMYSVESQIQMEQIRIGVQFPRDQDKLNETRLRMRQWPLYIDSPPNLTLNGMRAKARRMKKKYGIELLVVDYLQLMTTGAPGKNHNRQQEVADISRGIKSLAKELHIPIIILAQLNRKSDEKPGTEPALHNLRESGAIEQDADVVMLLHRPESNTEETDQPIPTVPYVLLIPKQRNGPNGRVDLLLRRAYTKFEEPVAARSLTSTVMADQPSII